MNLSEVKERPFKIVSHGAVFPNELGKFISNEQLADDVIGLNALEKVELCKKVALLGFENRFRVFASTTSVDLMANALNVAMRSSGLPSSDIDLLITVTTTSPRYTTSTAAMVSAACQLECAAFEMKTGCASPLYAIQIASQLLNDSVRTIAIVFGETLSKTVEATSKAVFAVGDGGAALIITHEKSFTKGLVWGGLGADGKYFSKMGVPGSMPPNLEDLQNGKYFMHYDSSLNQVFEDKWKELASLIKTRIAMQGIDRILMNQANSRMVTIFGEALGEDSTKIGGVLAKYGNCGTVSVMASLSNYLDTSLGKDKEILLASVGGGIAWGVLHLKI